MGHGDRNSVASDFRGYGFVVIMTHDAVSRRLARRSPRRYGAAASLSISAASAKSLSVIPPLSWVLRAKVTLV